ncbi:hypothetical protein TD95_005222 [Thielaviopsis punctulata]|uniref:DJ-1/PfpI domain-containing protein n=1 Tax=Thielaviopsis punctulata TaxID=72032 RepID=A0A0F4ZC44_9PEZI|nr:hypothetical protein TD95_005222 [Thielaviopsis punctulata]
MRLANFSSTALSLSSLASASASATASLMSDTRHVSNTATQPRNFGVVIFPSFQALDVFGPLDILNILSSSRHMNLSLIAETLDPVSTAPTQPQHNRFHSSFAERLVPTHTFSEPPPGLEVLFVPGGLGTRAPADQLEPVVSFIRTAYPSLKYLITVCTGAGLAARAGVLDGKRATTNKKAWVETVALGPKTYWVAKARWVADGNIYTTSGITAGIDGTFGWIEEVFGSDKAEELAVNMEYLRVKDADNDPFAVYWNVTDVPPVAGDVQTDEKPGPGSADEL